MNLELPSPFPPADISSAYPVWQLWYKQCNSKNCVFSVHEMNVSRIGCAMHRTQKVTRWKNIFETEICLVVISINHEYYLQIPDIHSKIV